VTNNLHVNAIRTFACYLFRIIFNITLRSISSSSNWWNLRFSRPRMSRSERLSQKRLYQYTKLHRVTFTVIIIFYQVFWPKFGMHFWPMSCVRHASAHIHFCWMFVPLVKERRLEDEWVAPGRCVADLALLSMQPVSASFTRISERLDMASCSRHGWAIREPAITLVCFITQL
jgi:hypothetical protein